MDPGAGKGRFTKVQLLKTKKTILKTRINVTASHMLRQYRTKGRTKLRAYCKYMAE